MPDAPTTQYPDRNVTAETTYTAGGQVATLTALNPTTGNQTTTYVYGTTLSDNGVARGDLLRGIIYPDSLDTYSMNGPVPTFTDGANGYDRVEYRYNKQGQQIEVKDQNQTVHDYVFDALGRQTEDRVTAFGADIDDAVKRIERTYEVRGMVAHTTSYDNATIGSGSVLNDVLDEYDDWGLLEKEYQLHDGEVDADHNGTPDAGVPYVEYHHADAIDGLRLDWVRYPNGRKVHYTYGTADLDNDVLNRLEAIKDDDGCGDPGDVGQLHLSRSEADSRRQLSRAGHRL